MTSLQLKSFAKLNLVLDLLFKRPDNYHEVSFFMQELELHDSLSFKLLEEPTISLECNDSSIYCDERNLIVKAAKLLQEQFNPSKGVKIFLEKQIPMAGGLGGSSSNASATIKALNKLWNLQLSESEMIRLAAKIGMDCCFSIIGNSCIAKGKSEVLERTLTPTQLDLLIAVPEVKVPEKKTAWIYSNFNVSLVSEHPSVERMLSAIKTQDKSEIALACGNAFEQGLQVQEYNLVWGLIKELKSEKGVLNACLAGAGPSVFAVCENQRFALELATKLSERQCLRAFTTKTRT